MFRIGEFSKMSRTTVKALRYYDEIGILKPECIDKFTNYRLYSTDQLITLHKIKAMRQAGLSIDEIRCILDGEDGTKLLENRRSLLISEIRERERMLSGLEFLISERKSFMNYQANIKEIPEYIVYSVRMRVDTFEELCQRIPGIGEKVMKKYLNIKCAKPEYCVCIFHDEEYREKDIDVEFCEAVTEMHEDFSDVRFKKLPSAQVLSVLHKGGYDGLFEANVFAYKWIEDNGYTPVGSARNSYIDGVWNKEREDDWLTEIQIPIEPKPDCIKR